MNMNPNNMSAQLASGTIAYIWPPAVSGLLAWLIISRGMNPVLIYPAILLCYGFITFYCKYRGLASRFAAAQSNLMGVFLAGILLGVNAVFGEGASMFENLGNRAAETMEWAYMIAVAIPIALFLVCTAICAWNSRGYGIYPLPLLGRWAWQSAVLDDTSGEYATYEQMRYGKE